MNEDIQALFKVIDILQRSEKLTFLKTFIESLLDVIPRNAAGFDLICYAYYKAKDYKNAIKYGELALGGASTTEAIAIRYNLGKCYLNANEPFKSRNAFTIVSNLQPEKIDIKLDLAAALYACNQKDEANALLLELDAEGWRLDPKDEAAVQFNLGTHYIRNGDFKKGMEFLSIGRKLRIWGSYSHNFPIPEWDGTTAEGKHILIVGEGGLGDEIINARFVRNINDRGMKASFASCQKLDTVFARMPFDKTQNYVKFTTDIKDITDYDYWTPAMNLPKVLGVDIDELWNGPYLTAGPTYDSKWKNRLTGDFKVGLRWSGNPLYEQDLHRSISLDAVYKVLPPEWTKYSIQKENTDILQQYPDITNLESELETFEDAIACINNLDVVVTSCTSVAHAAAALGKRVFIMVPIMDYYVWGEGKSTSSWYGDNVTLIRQTKPKSWDSAYAELRDALLKL
jgi:tetratricopeptide (TPR) repeat protein